MGFKKFMRKVFVQEATLGTRATSPETRIADTPARVRKGRIGILVVALLSAAAAFFGFEIPEPLLELIAGALE